jgi:hypothetical protein
MTFGEVPYPRIRIRGSMPLTNGSGSCYLVIDLQDANKKIIFLKSLSASYFLRVDTSFFQDKKSKRSYKTVSHYFCLLIEGTGPGSGSVPIPLTKGSGSGRPKNMWIRWIRIRNTGFLLLLVTSVGDP